MPTWKQKIQVGRPCTAFAKGVQRLGLLAGESVGDAFCASRNYDEIWMKKQAVRLGAIFVGWTLLAMFWAANRSLYRVTIGQPASFVETFRPILLDFWLWALLTPAIFYLARKFQFTRHNWARSSAVHFCAYIALSCLHEVLGLLLRIPAFIPAGFHGSLLKLRVVQSLNGDFWMYWPIVVHLEPCRVLPALSGA